MERGLEFVVVGFVVVAGRVAVAQEAADEELLFGREVQLARGLFLETKHISRTTGLEMGYERPYQEAAVAYHSEIRRLVAENMAVRFGIQGPAFDSQVGRVAFGIVGIDGVGQATSSLVSL